MRARRWWGWPLVPVYWAGLRVKDGLRAVGVLRVRRLEWPVVSVGSLSAGGAGKTPVVIALAELLVARRWGVDVLSRGYGREGVGVERVDLMVEDAARRFGDEPVLIAAAVGVPVWVGADRFAAGVMAEGLASASANANAKYGGLSTSLRSGRDDGHIGRVHLLDDGFQHRRLGRAVDVVVVTAEDLEEAMLPAGNRREPLGALRRADAVVLREEELAALEARVRGLIRVGVPIWVVRRTISFRGSTYPTHDVQVVMNGGRGDLGEPTPDAEAGMDGVRGSEVGGYGLEGAAAGGGGVVAFCGIARPQGFFGMLRGAGVRVAAEVAFPDHHRYTAADVSRLVDSCHLEGGRGFVMTAKDAVKIGPELRAMLGAAGPVHVARLAASFVDPEGVVCALEARLR